MTDVNMSQIFAHFHVSNERERDALKALGRFVWIFSGERPRSDFPQFANADDEGDLDFDIRHAEDAQRVALGLVALLSPDRGDMRDEARRVLLGAIAKAIAEGSSRRADVLSELRRHRQLAA